MANLQLNIDVNDEEFQKVCAENINNLPKEKLEEILLKAVEVALIKDKENPDCEKGNNILVTQVRQNTAWGTTYKYEPTELLKEVIKKVDLSTYIEDIAKTIRQYIENNYQEIIKQYVVEKFAQMIFSDDKKWELRSAIVNDINNRLM